MFEGIRWVKQSTFIFEKDRTLYIDPWGLPDDAPNADAILITHAHFDHFSAEDIAKIRSEDTQVFAPPDVASEIEGDVNVVSPGDAFEVLGWSTDSVPAYNTHPDRLDLHPKDNGWLGYVFTIDGVRYYHAGDTDPIEEMQSIECDVAFLPIGGHYTMGPEEAVEAVKAIEPKVVVPMHYGFVVGDRSYAQRLAEAVSPLEVKIFEPEVPFEK